MPESILPKQGFLTRPYVTVCILSLLYAFSFLDRNLPSLLLRDIKHDLSLSDTEVSLLTGTAFAIVYVLASFPLSRLADRGSRRSVIAIGVFIWGVMTALCGAASSFLLFFVARMGVGLGEAAITPASHSLIATLFPAGQRGRPMAIFNLGAILGMGSAMLVGAGAVALIEVGKSAFPQFFLAAVPTWRLVMMSIGLLTLLLVLLAVRIADPASASRADPTADQSLRKVLGVMWKERGAYAPLVLAIPFTNLGIFGFNTWVPSLFIRTHGWGESETGLKVGMASVIGGLVGALFSSLVSDRLASRSAAAPLNIVLCSITACTIIAWLIVLTNNPNIQLLLIGTLHVAVFPMGVLGVVALQGITHPSIRAQASAIFVMVAVLVGVGAGPTVVAVFTDFIIQDEQHVHWSMAYTWLLVMLVSGPIILFNRSAYVRAVLAAGDQEV